MYKRGENQILDDVVDEIEKLTRRLDNAKAKARNIKKSMRKRPEWQLVLMYIGVFIAFSVIVSLMLRSCNG